MVKTKLLNLIEPVQQIRVFRPEDLTSAFGIIKTAERIDYRNVKHVRRTPEPVIIHLTVIYDIHTVFPIHTRNSFLKSFLLQRSVQSVVFFNQIQRNRNNTLCHILIDFK